MSRAGGPFPRLSRPPTRLSIYTRNGLADPPAATARPPRIGRSGAHTTLYTRAAFVESRRIPKTVLLLYERTYRYTLHSTVHSSRLPYELSIHVTTHASSTAEPETLGSRPSNVTRQRRRASNSSARRTSRSLLRGAKMSPAITCVFSESATTSSSPRGRRATAAAVAVKALTLCVVRACVRACVRTCKAGRTLLSEGQASEGCPLLSKQQRASRRAHQPPTLLTTYGRAHLSAGLAIASTGSRRPS